MTPLNELSGRVKRSYTVPWIIEKLTLMSVVIPYQALCQRSGSTHQLKLRIFGYQFGKEVACIMARSLTSSATLPVFGPWSTSY